MEIKREQDQLLIMCGGKIIKTSPYNGVSDKFGMANYEQRIFYGRRNHYCVFYYYDDVKHEILNLYSLTLGGDFGFYPKLGYVYYVENDNACVDRITKDKIYRIFQMKISLRNMSIKALMKDHILFYYFNHVLVYNMNSLHSEPLYDREVSVTNNRICVFVKDGLCEFVPVHLLNECYVILLLKCDEVKILDDGTIFTSFPDGKWLYRRLDADGSLHVIDWKPEEFIFPFSNQYLSTLSEILYVTSLPNVLMNIIKSYF